MSELITV